MRKLDYLFKYSLVFIFLLSLRSAGYSQSASKYHIIQLDYDIKSNFNFPLQWAKGTTKYSYDVNGNLISIKTFDKYDLTNVRKFDFSHSLNKTIITQPNGVTGFLTLDAQGRVIEANYYSALLEHSQTFPYIYKFKYSADGYLVRITSYYYDSFAKDPDPQQIHTIYQLNYENGNLISMKTVYVDDSDYVAPDYDFTYSDKIATPNWNPTIGLFINQQTDKYPLYAIPNNLFGKQSKNLLKTISQKVPGDYNVETEISVYNISYSFNSDGSVSQIIIPRGDVNSTFNLTYNKPN